MISLGKPFSFYVKRSTIVHIALVALTFIISNKVLFNSDLKNSNISLVQSSVRVDVVAMPKMTIKELQAINQQMAKSSGVKEEVVEESAESTDSNETSKVEFETEKKKQNFMDMIKKFSKKKVEKTKKVKKKSGSSDSGVSGKDLEKINQLVVEGNKISQGTSLVGDGGTAAQAALGSYMTSLRDEVKVYWKLPSYLLNKDLRCRVRVFISQSGKLVKAEIFESSGNADYDAKALEAVKLSAPFPSVPEEIVTKIGRGEILLGFPL